MLVPLDRLEPKDSCGGKARSLAKLVAAGVRVPEGFVVLAEAFREHVSRAGTEFERVRVESFAPSLLRLVESNLEKAPGPWAVRSSASDEDGATRAWAGVFRSYLNIHRTEVPERIKDCWASVFTDEAEAYAAANYISIRSLDMAVVVQRLIFSRAAGVAFSQSPLSKGEILVESSFGLGEAVVSGAVTPDRYSVERESLEISSREIAVKSKALYPNSDGPARWSFLLRVEGKAPSLLDSEVRQIAAAALEIERLFGYPVDVEWAFEGDTLYVLQARPITR